MFHWDGQPSYIFQFIEAEVTRNIPTVISVMIWTISYGENVFFLFKADVQYAEADFD